MLETRNPDLSRSLENFARGLLATTCLTMAGGTTALASTVTLSFGAQPTAPGDLLPTGTNIVNGYVGELPGEAGFSAADWFEFQALTPGSSYTLTGMPIPSDLGKDLEMSVFNSSQSQLFPTQGLEGGASFTGTIPGDGKLDVEVFVACECGGEKGGGAFDSVRSFFSAEAGPVNYQVQLTQPVASTVPEPASLATAGLALAGGLAWSRKRRQ